MKSALGRKDVDKFKFIHAVYPKSIAERRSDSRKGQRNKNFHSQFLSVDENRFFEEKQLNTLPYVVGRFRVRADEIYGKSPAMEALPAIRRLNEISNELAQFARLSLNPPFIAPSEAKQVGFKWKANHINLGAVNKDGKQLFHPLQLGNPLPYYDEVKRIQGAIHSLFLLDLFQVLDDKASRSAAESMEKTREKGAFVGPLIGGLQSEFIGMMIRRECDILNSQGKIPFLEGYDHSPVHVLKVEYTSPLFKYQQAEMVSSMLQGTNTAIELGAKTGDPSCIDHVDIDTVTRVSLWASGTPAQCIRDWGTVDKIRKERADQMEQMRKQRLVDQQEQVGMETGAKVAGEVMTEKMKSDMRKSLDG